MSQQTKMRSEQQANQSMQSYVEKVAQEKAEWQRVLSAPVKPANRKVKQGFFSKIFKRI